MPKQETKICKECLAHLQSLGGEFDERAAEEKGHLLASRVSKTYSISPNAHVILQGNSFIDGARWMHSEMQARVVAHQLHEEATVVQANDKIKALEAELAELKSKNSKEWIKDINERCDRIQRICDTVNPSDSECARDIDK